VPSSRHVLINDSMSKTRDLSLHHILRTAPTSSDSSRTNSIRTFTQSIIAMMNLGNIARTNLARATIRPAMAGPLQTSIRPLAVTRVAIGSQRMIITGSGYGKGFRFQTNSQEGQNKLSHTQPHDSEILAKLDRLQRSIDDINQSRPSVKFRTALKRFKSEIHPQYQYITRETVFVRLRHLPCAFIVYAANFPGCSGHTLPFLYSFSGCRWLCF
jgi:hypothetical protein